jgi:hypothetical protein
VHFFNFLKTKGRNKHRGEILEAAVKESPISITKLTKQMGISRGTYYNHINDAQLGFEQLIQYGRVLKHDFTQDFPEMRKYSFEEPEAVYNIPGNLAEAIEQRDYWRDKYYQLMEQFHKLVMEKRAGD